MKYSFKVFRLSKHAIRQKWENEKKRYTIKTKMNGISWIDKCEKSGVEVPKETLTIYTLGFVIIFRLLY